MNPILITGAARSGTSLTAGCFHLAGAFGGEMSGPNQYNKKGMFENSKIREILVKPYLKKIGVDPLGQNPLPNSDQIIIDEKWREKVLQIIKEDGYIGGKWFYKGAKMALMWQVWNKAFPEALWIIVRRPDEQIINSCLRTSFMRKCTGEIGWRNWLEFHKEKFIEMNNNDLNLIEIWSSKIVNRDYHELLQILNSCNLSIDLNELDFFVEPSLFGGINE